MSPALAALLLSIQAAPSAPPAVPPDIMFLFFKVHALRDRTRALGCRAPEQDRRYEDVRKRLIARYGPSIFSPPKAPKGPPGDCGVVMVYDVNLADLERAATAATKPTIGS